MNRGESVWVAICITSTPNATTNPVSPTIAPTIALRTVLAVAFVYVHARWGSRTESSSIAAQASTGPAIAQTSGTIQRLPRSRWRRAKRAAQDQRGTLVRGALRPTSHVCGKRHITRSE